jgi:HD-GYP domain-containing protein (c-di-GMP phosphodiesterase class II)/HAMP domain-containing protein
MNISSDAIFSLLRSKVARRMLAIFVLCALLPVCVLGGISLVQVYGRLESETYRALSHASRSAAVSLLEAFSVISSEMETTAEIHASYKRGQHTDGPYRNTYEQPRLRALTLYDEEGKHTVLFGDPCPQPPLNNQQRNHLASGKAILFLDKDRSPPRIFMAIRDVSRGVHAALLVGELNQAYLWKATMRAVPSNFDLSVLLSSTDIVFSASPVSQKALTNEDGSPFKGHSGHFQWRGYQEAYLSSYWTVNLGPGYLCEDLIVMTSQSRSIALSSLHRFTTLFLMILLLMLLIVFLLSLVQIRKNLVPLARLKEGTERVARGDLESPVTVQSGDEFEDLANAFNAMSGQLKKQFDNLNRMGRVVRTILTSHDRTRIAESVLNDLLSVVMCDCIALALLKSESPGEAEAYCVDNTERTTPRKFQFRCVLAGQQITLLERTMDNITEGHGASFSSITAPLYERGTRFFAVIPLRNSHRVVGALTLAYQEEPASFREDLARGRQLADHIAAAISNADLLNDLAELNLGTLTALARAVDANSHWTAGHSERVTALSMDMAQAMGLSKKDLDTLHQAGLLHDLGKIGVPSSILEKPGKLTEEEWVIIKEHPGKGSLILEPIPAFKEIVPLVAQHHERFDGNGYPSRLVGADITLGARILAVADVYDALISDRPYRSGWHLPDVIQFINSRAGIDFDPEVVRAFRSLRLDGRATGFLDQENHSANILRLVR